MILASTLLCLLATTNAQTANVTGNCVSGVWKYNPNRVKHMNGVAVHTVDPSLDVSAWDWIVEYGSDNIKQNGDGFDMSLKKNKDANKAAEGVKLSTTRYILYGKITAKFASVGTPGVVNTFITMSDVEDEIDWEITGPAPIAPNSNLFYHSKGRADKELGGHGGVHPIDDASKVHTYVIDWKRNVLEWGINGKVVRSLKKSESKSKSDPSGPAWYPITPSMVQFALWDGGSPESAEGTRKWAGGPINWGGKDTLTANFQSVEIQCYDDKDQPVPKWPISKNNPDLGPDPPKEEQKKGSGPTAPPPTVATIPMQNSPSGNSNGNTANSNANNAAKPLPSGTSEQQQQSGDYRSNIFAAFSVGAALLVSYALV
ncbi:concanavalin A-like lectin/glucanase domain-containing protein [Globomyces pollinis-pini]|nr:concanavalin A-like lectin/glucanase domain-containing protein [Globomyces pollinis-pini]KAJ2994987.1 hypothetical protein HDV02_001161 [Globomyces sp. JEL0801]